MALSLSSTQFVAGTISPVDRKGNLSSVQSDSVVYSSSDNAVFTVAPDTDNKLAFTLTAVGVGSATFSVTALSENGTSITATADITVTVSQAASLNINFGTPQDQ